MPSRNWHSKSRLGCTQCKKRHIKCDLKQTGCDKCNSKGIVCDFQQQQPRKPSGSENTSCTTRANSTIPDRYQYPAASNDLVQLHTAGKLLCLVEDNELMHLWDPILSAQVRKHSFLKHAFRALAILRSYATISSVRMDDYMGGVGNPSWIPTVMFTMAIVILEIRGFIIDQTPQSLLNVLTTLRSTAKLVESIAADFMRRQQARERLRDAFVLKNPWAQLATEQRIEELDRAILALYIDTDHLGAHHQQNSVKLGEPVAWLQCYFWASTLSDAPKSWFFEGWRETVPLYLQKNIAQANVVGLLKKEVEKNHGRVEENQWCAS
ncbi:hypothetical protein FSARC_1973 [Fusarium sarcochroum]|uniref:Zn(2)-C6 fungal-type domain-containing protein n=1 Tax=Fusarium sarcochroum TaxID=1208366 RepID=A0A8H4U7R0_9HYPO|nr:hypothetical protein FSARC_1973 [Fusarium sarcochroum]